MTLYIYPYICNIYLHILSHEKHQIESKNMSVIKIVKAVIALLVSVQHFTLITPFVESTDVYKERKKATYSSFSYSV